MPACAAEIGPGRLRGVGLKRSLRFALGLGSNSGDRERALCDAIRLLAVDERVSDLRLSGLYETEPWGGVEGGAFLNAVAVASFRGSGEALRDLCRAVEISCGSSIEKAGRSRRLDLDILFLDPPAVVPGLEIPHPGMALPTIYHHHFLFIFINLRSLKPLGPASEVFAARVANKAEVCTTPMFTYPQSLVGQWLSIAYLLSFTFPYRHGR